MNKAKGDKNNLVVIFNHNKSTLNRIKPAA